MYIDLKARFGDRFRIAFEGNYTGPNPWLQVIPCAHGRIEARGEGMLGALTHCRDVTALPGVRVVQDDEHGINIAFDVAHFDDVAALLKPEPLAEN